MRWGGLGEEGGQSLIWWDWFSLESTILLKEVFCSEYQQASSSCLLLCLAGRASNRLTMRCDDKHPEFVSKFESYTPLTK